MRKSFCGQSASVSCVGGLCYCCSLVYSVRTVFGRLSNIILKSTCIVNMKIENSGNYSREHEGGIVTPCPSCRAIDHFPQ